MDRDELRIKIGMTMGVGVLSPTILPHSIVIRLLNDHTAHNDTVDLRTLRNETGEIMHAMYAVTETIDKILNEQNQSKYAKEKRTAVQPGAESNGHHA